NQTFDVATYGNSANGTEAPSKINVLNVNLFSTITASRLNEFHLTYSRESRPRSAVPSSVPADTAMGFATTFRFGNPFFLAPNVDEVIKRFQLKDNFSIVTGKHTIKTGGEWVHTNNAQIFRGFFEGRYIFDSVAGFLRYASPAAPGGFGPFSVGWDDSQSVETISAARRVRVGRKPGWQVGRPRQRRHLLRQAEHAQPGWIGHYERDSAEKRLPQHLVHGVCRHARMAEPARAE